MGLACSRCLEGFTVPVDAAFDLLYLPMATEPAAAEQEVAEDDLGTSYYGTASSTSASSCGEQLYLALPMKRLCQDACRGLCPDCGTNLNTGSCSCAHRWEDPRHAPLKALTRRTTMPIRNDATRRPGGRKRRTHDALTAVPAGVCPQCQESKAPHRGVPALRLLQGTPGPAG